jgi:hypothetical protein
MFRPYRLPAFGGSKPPLRYAWVAGGWEPPFLPPLRVGCSGGWEPPFLPKMSG